MNGIIFWGTFERGKWSGANSLKSKLRKGGVLKPNEDLVTIAPRQKDSCEAQSS